MDHAAEWLEADGLGGFASGTVGGVRTRRYHALLLAATTPPTGRYVLVSGCDAWIERDGQRFPLSTQCYTPGVTSPDGERRLETFSLLPWPSWRYRLEDGTEVEQQLFAVHGSPRVVLSWKLTRPAPGVRLVVRPFLSGRDYHALHHENPAFRFDARQEGDSVRWHPYDGVPEVMVRSNGAYTREPLWYRGFLYAEERDRGLDCVEDLASPGSFTWNLSAGEALWSLAAASGVAADGRPELSTEIARLRAAGRDRMIPLAEHIARLTGSLKQASPFSVLEGRLDSIASWQETFRLLVGMCKDDDVDAILLAIANYLIQQHLYNRDFVRRWWNWQEYLRAEHPEVAPTFENFEAVLQHLYTDYTFAFAAQESGVDDPLDGSS